MIKKVIVGFLCVMVTFVFSGFTEFSDNLNLEPYDPGNEFAFNVVIVEVKVEFQEEFHSNQFFVEDFGWENADCIDYYPFGNVNPDKTNGHIKVYLKEQGRQQVIDAVEHFKTLDFVYNAYEKFFFALDKFTVYIKDNFHQKFIEQQFTVEEFNWDNVESITYRAWQDSLYDREITIFLKKHGREEVIEGIEHFRRLNFVKDAKVSSYLQLD